MVETQTDTPRAGRPLNILIVDDSAMMRALIRRVAGLSDVAIGNVYEAANGREAIELLETHQVDCIFTDINMPVMTGPELLREIEKRPEWHQMTRVVISTDGTAARREEARGLHVRFYMEKPIRPEAVRDVLARITIADAR
jgi:two-component system chemotaxis response regulator CheY